jgi:hypothetical protein
MRKFGRDRHERALKRHKAARCNDCRVKTTPRRRRDRVTNGTWEWYRVHDHVWAEAGMGWRGFLCIGCLEKRLGRTLCRDDFVGVDESSLDTPRLRARYRSAITA